MLVGGSMDRLRRLDRFAAHGQLEATRSQVHLRANFHDLLWRNQEVR